MENDVLTNKSAGALLRDSELELVKRKEQPLNLKALHKHDNLDNYIGRDVTIPDELAAYLKANLHFDRSDDMPPHEVHLLEWMVEYFHGVKPPYYISMSITLQQTGRPWAYVPEAGEYLTGFTLHKQ